MSMIRQLWLLVFLVTIGACGASLVTSLLSNSHYLEDQLRLKNHDNAASLAISLSQQAGDMSSIELLMTAQYDTGHYQRISLVNPEGRTLFEFGGKPPPMTTPAWFVAALPIKSVPGVAQVSSGWQAVGTITVVSHSAFAYDQLWSGAVRLALLLALVGLLSGLCGTVLVRRTTRPLKSLVEQARALSERRFIKSNVSGVPELMTLTSAMNSMVDRVGAQFSEHAATVERLRLAAVTDTVTGLVNRGEFQRRLDELLGVPQALMEGLFLIVRVRELQRMNQELGRSETDRLLARLGEALETLARAQSGGFCGRLNGADFALLLPGTKLDAEAFGDLRRRLRGFDATSSTLPDLAIGATLLRQDTSTGQLLTRADAALTIAESEPQRFALLEFIQDEVKVKGQSDWRRDLQQALDDRKISGRLRQITGRDGSIMHRQFDTHIAWDGDDYRPPAEWLPFAIRAGLAASIEESAIEQALETAAHSETDLALPLSEQALRDGTVLARLVEQLGAAPSAAARLIIEVPEFLVHRDPDFAADLARTLRRSGARIALFDAGHYVSRIRRLPELQLHHLRTNLALAAGSGGAQRAYLAAVVSICRGLGIRVVLETADVAIDLRTTDADAAVSPRYEE